MHPVCKRLLRLLRQSVGHFLRQPVKAGLIDTDQALPWAVQVHDQGKRSGKNERQRQAQNRHDGRTSSPISIIAIAPTNSSSHHASPGMRFSPAAIRSSEASMLSFRVARKAP